MIPPNKSDVAYQVFEQATRINMADLNEIAQRLVDRLRDFSHIAVAFSGGVDSAVVAAAAYRAVGDRAIAMTSCGESVPQNQIQWAVQTAQEIGIQHHLVKTAELSREEYRANDAQRCFYCKQTLYDSLANALSQILSLHADCRATLVSGTNADDLGDYRPGIQAGKQAGVQTPLADLGLGKEIVRKLAKHWGLSVWDLPAAPCLASRIAYGTEVTVDRLRKIEQAESWLRERGFREFRVRLHAGELARVEVPQNQFPRFADAEFSGEFNRVMQEIGFHFVTLDLAGFRSGSLNKLIQIQT